MALILALFCLRSWGYSACQPISLFLKPINFLQKQVLSPRHKKSILCYSGSRLSHHHMCHLNISTICLIGTLKKGEFVPWNSLAVLCFYCYKPIYIIKRFWTLGHSFGTLIRLYTPRQNMATTTAQGHIQNTHCHIFSSHSYGDSCLFDDTLGEGAN